MSDAISLIVPGRPGRFGANVHFRAIRHRCQRRIVSGVTMVATCLRIRRPSGWPFAVRRRRWSSVNRTRRPFSCSLRTRFSSTRYSMTSCWWRLTHPARVTNSSRKGERSAVIGRSYRATLGAVPGTGSAEYSDTTRPLPLTPTEFELLATLASAPGRLFRRQELRAILWGRGDAVQPRTIDVHVARLRRKLVDAGGSSSVITTVHGVGCRFRSAKTPDTL